MNGDENFLNLNIYTKEQAENLILQFENSIKNLIERQKEIDEDIERFKKIIEELKSID